MEQTGKRRNIDVGSCFEAFEPRVEKIGFIDEKCLVRAKCWINAEPKVLGVDCDVVFQRVGGIVSGASYTDVKLSKDVLRRKVIRLQSLIGAVPNGFGGLFVEQSVDIEVALKFEMSPMIERIAQGVRNGARPRQEFLFRGSPSGAEASGTPLARMARHL